ncbi:endonuclease/exonuclease/phosphatase family protein [Rhodoplanes sp. TEM]|uniref:Endonuclease/exonuclease/phosphatase family protein n=1 Tax=Rhodoplanes tepidamans TaxID=200616 RepID=A0ABT5J6R4_RHOTP|nr:MULTISPECIES: endonuclease/exonuclease/phosphatase family protein [Rhodoplanes]MDC7785306.1 endonuclease/exonuclease/phosphatase family protein [Rhodoplanes tepidamans]MDC7987271.1 endonuclease/exonuclease/phosphatase family protein [Rhodoplanes sp. TEM]MDQ0353564.1 endonuclease/exonuclease/phosphatase (EEP) superfamily protein YafD [Rhodoplanes tepidamans]
MQIGFYGILGLGLPLVAVTVLSALPSQERWIRVWDFPRAQIAVLLAAVMLAAALLLPVGEPPGIALMGLMGAALAWQAWRIWPYTTLHRVQVGAARSCPDGAQIVLVVSNVRQGNRRSGRLLALIRDIDPDLVLLVETDAWWDAALRPLAASHPHAIRCPRDNTYGMHLFSRLELHDAEIRHLVSDQIPSIRTGVRLRSGESIVLYGVHPRPPPRADTAQRDAELVLVAQEVRRGEAPAIVAGDLNDVAWSRTNGLFQDVSGLLDPRIGRGLYPTFHADWRLLRWPLDHVFLAPAFRLRALRVLPSIGSDHLPLLVAVCHCPEAADRHPALAPERADRARARDVVATGRRAACESDATTERVDRI